MAHSSAVKPAQAIKMCELCNEENIKWRCIDCEICLCEKCENFHLRLPLTAKHQIVTIATTIQDVKRKVVTDNIPCKDHVENSTCMFCKTCECLVCPVCVSTSHTKHQFIHIEKALDGKLKQFKALRENIIDSLKYCDSQTTELQIIMPQYDTIFDESVTNIKQKEEELKKAITENSKLLQEKVENERSKIKTITAKVGQKIIGAKKKLKDLQEELETAFTSNQGRVIFDTTLTKPVLDFGDLRPNGKTFIPNAVKTNKIQEMFGYFQDVQIPPIKPEFGLEVLNTLDTDYSSVDKVIPLNKTSAWILCSISVDQVITKVTIQENKMNVLNDTTFQVYDMALRSDNEILLTLNGKSDVMLLTSSGQLSSFLSLKPLIPRGIHVTNDNKIILGVNERFDRFQLSYQIQRAVIVFGRDGKQKHRYQYDRNKKSLFNIPWRITTNINEDILVIDKITLGQDRLVTLDREGNVRWIYDGHPKISHNKGSKQFEATGITTTAEGYIIVSDHNCHALHVLSENGDLLTYKIMAHIRIMYPRGLNMDREGKLWLACGGGIINSKGQLHILKMKLSVFPSQT